MVRIWILVAVCLLVTACGKAPCLTAQPYKTAEPFPPLRAPVGLDVPEPDPNFSIPEVASGPVGAFPADEGVGDTGRLRCLAMPPRLPSRQG